MSHSRPAQILQRLLIGIALFSPITTLAEIVVEDAWARATPPGARTGAIYLTLSNDGAADSLVGAATEAADRAELHTHVHENGMMAMLEVESIGLPAGGTTRLKPHGDHVMLFGLRGPLVAGEALNLTLEFSLGAPLTVAVPIRDGRSP
jgi:copper(I)-binding protein